MENKIYKEEELCKGKCWMCNSWTGTIVIGDGRCIDCVENVKFKDIKNNKPNNDKE